MFSATYEYPGGWYFNVEPSGWTEDQPVNPFGVSAIIHKADGEWKYFNVGNPSFMKRSALASRLRFRRSMRP